MRFFVFIAQNFSYVRPMMSLEEIAKEASRLDEDSRASLASRLLRSLPPPRVTVTDSEVLRRMKEAEENPAVMISHEELLSGLSHHGN